MFHIDWFTPIYLLAIYGLVRFFSKYSSTEGDAKKAHYTPLEAVGVSLFIFFAAQLIGGLAIYAAALTRGGSGKAAFDWVENNIYGQFIATALIEGLTLGLLLLFLKKRRATLKTIGLKRRPQLTDAAWALAGLIVYFVLFVIFSSVVKRYVPGLNVEQKQEIGFSHPSSIQLPFVFISLVLLPPVVEELLVRGFMYTGLRTRLSKPVSYLIASGIFGVAHLQAGNGQPLLWIAAIDTFTLSIVLIHLREKTKSLWASICLHMLKNGIAFVSLFFLKLG